MIEPHWEHGYRCHGYWLGLKRIGVVGIGHERGAAKKSGYRWRMDFWYYNRESVMSLTLRAAKRAVEKAHRQHVKETNS